MVRTNCVQRLRMLGLAVVCGAFAFPLHAAGADEPQQPTSNWGSMPNGWDGYSLSQLGGLNNMSPPGLQNQHGHGDGHGHGHGHDHGHGHGLHGGFFWYGYPYGNYAFGYSGNYPVNVYCPRCLSPFCRDPFCVGFPAQRLAVQGLAVQGLAVQGLAVQGLGLGVARGPAVVNRIPVNRGVVQRALANQALADRALAERALAERDAAEVPFGGADGAAAEIMRRVSVLRDSTPGGRDRSDRTLAQADRYFADQSYGRATARYRQAWAQAPDYPKPLFRLGHAYVATRDYELALTYFLMALEINGSPDRPGFALEDLYRGNALTKQAHLDELSDAALRQPEDGGLLMLVGLTLFYDGQKERAQGFFERAAALPGAQQTYAEWFGG